MDGYEHGGYECLVVVLRLTRLVPWMANLCDLQQKYGSLGRPGREKSLEKLLPYVMWYNFHHKGLNNDLR